MNGDRQATPRHRVDLETIEVDGELVIWDPSDDRIHRLDPVASLLWTHLDGSATIQELADDVAEVFGQPTEAVAEAIAVLVRELTESGLLIGES